MLNSDSNYLKFSLFIVPIVLLFACQQSNNKPEETPQQNTPPKEELKEEVIEKNLFFLSFWEDMSKIEYEIVCDRLVNQGLLKSPEIYNDDFFLVYKGCSQVRVHPHFEYGKLKMITLKDAYCLYPDLKNKYQLPSLVNLNYKWYEVKFEKNWEYDFKKEYMFVENGRVTMKSTDPQWVDKLKAPSGNRETYYLDEQILPKDTIDIYNPHNVILIIQYIKEKSDAYYSLKHFKLIDFDNFDTEDYNEWKAKHPMPKVFEGTLSESIINAEAVEGVIKSNSLHVLTKTTKEYYCEVVYYAKSHYEKILESQEKKKFNMQNQEQKLEEQIEQNNQLILDGL